MTTSSLMLKLAINRENRVPLYDYAVAHPVYLVPRRWVLTMERPDRKTVRVSFSGVRAVENALSLASTCCELFPATVCKLRTSPLN
jgi:hypothetical protein